MRHGGAPARRRPRRRYRERPEDAVSWFLAFAGFAALIILHEAGHFVAAKAVGMRVERFFLFFPPKIWSFKRGETEYGIGAIPLGGFVKITGMNPDEELDEDVAPRAYYHQPVWKRIVVIAAGPFVNLVIAFVILFGIGFTLEEPTALAVGAVEKDTPAAAELRARRPARVDQRRRARRRQRRGAGRPADRRARRPRVRRAGDRRLPGDDGDPGRRRARRRADDARDAPVLRLRGRPVPLRVRVRRGRLRRRRPLGAVPRPTSRSTGCGT